MRLDILGVIKLLLKYGANPLLENSKGETPLFLCGYYDYGDEYVHWVAEGTKWDIRQLLEEAEARQQALEYAARYGDLDEIEKLIKEGGSVNAVDKNGSTLLHLAIENGHEDVAEFLVENGADIDAKDKNGWTPLYVATDNDAVDVVRLLIQNGANVNAKDKNGWTSLQMAAMYGNEDIAGLLIDNGADVNARNDSGRTPLHLTHGNINVVKLLIDNGADINAVDSDGLTPLSRAFSESKVGVCAYMMNKIMEQHSAGLGVNQRDLQLKPEIERKIFLYNHQPLIDVLSEHYEYDFQKMTFADIKTFFQEHRNYITVEFAGIEKHLIDFVDFEDVKEIHVPRVGLYVFVEAIKNNLLDGNLDDPSVEQHQAISKARPS